jgi:hypothetical protein
MKRVVFGTNSDRERHEEYLRHFFKEVDKGVNRILEGRAGPLILAGVEEEVALYRCTTAPWKSLAGFSRRYCKRPWSG